MKLVIVEWVDIMNYAERNPVFVAGDASLARCKTAGFLVAKTKEKIVVALNRYDIPEVPHEIISDYSVIPMGCVKSITYLA